MRTTLAARLWCRFAVVFGALGVSSAFGGAKLEDRLLPDLLSHLKYASENLKSGRYGPMKAHAEAILTPIVTFKLKLDGIDAAQAERCRVAAQKAIEAWQSSLGGDLEFIPCEDPRPDVTIEFQPKRLASGHAGAGYARWQRSVFEYPSGDAETKLSATVQVRALGFGGEPLPEDTLAQIAEHELGHVLGLKESNRTGDVMGPINLKRPVLSPGDAEIAGLKAIRAQAADLRRQAEFLLQVNLGRV